MDKKITNLAVFDFDGTLVNTPLPDTGRETYKTKTGLDWPHSGWWGKKESLDMEIFDMPVIADVITDYEKALLDESTAVVLLTGRMIKLSDHVRIILDTKGLKFDDYHYNKGGATEVAKLQSMDELLKKYKDVAEITMYDDRLAHIPIFQKWGDEQIISGRLEHFKINVVNPENTRHS